MRFQSQVSEFFFTEDEPLRRCTLYVINNISYGYVATLTWLWNGDVSPGSATRRIVNSGYWIFYHLLRIRSCGLFQFKITSEIMSHRHMVGLLGRLISSSQGLYLHRATHHRETRTNIHALSGIRNRDPVYERSRPAPQTARPLDRLDIEFISVIFKVN
jgi:hypothetical protein